MRWFKMSQPCTACGHHKMWHRVLGQQGRKFCEYGDCRCTLYSTREPVASLAPEPERVNPRIPEADRETAVGLIGRRCSMCAITWPDSDRFLLCGKCGAPTWEQDRAVFTELDRRYAYFAEQSFDAELAAWLS